MTEPVGEYQHPSRVLELLTPEQGYPNLGAAYGSELHLRLYELSHFLWYSCNDTGPESWHERLLTLAAAMLLNIHAAKQHWNRSEWSPLLEFLADFDHRMEELKGMANPVSS